VVPAKTTLEWTGCGTANYTGAVTLTDSTTVTVDLVDNAGIRKSRMESSGVLLNEKLNYTRMVRHKN